MPKGQEPTGADLIARWQREQPARGKALAKATRQLGSGGTGNKKDGSLDERAEAAHEEAFSRIDCLDCANCCRSIPPIVNTADAKRLARFLRVSEGELHERYLTRDEDGDTVMNASPCPFLASDNHCLVYDARPKACRGYPHTDEGFSRNLDLHARNLAVCPATWNILERLTGTLPTALR